MTDKPSPEITPISPAEVTSEQTAGLPPAPKNVEEGLNAAAAVGGSDVVKDATEAAVQTPQGRQIVNRLIEEPETKLSPAAAKGVVEGAAAATQPKKPGI